MSMQLAQNQQNQDSNSLLPARLRLSVDMLVALYQPSFGPYPSLLFNVSIWLLTACLPQVWWLYMLLFLLMGLASEGLLSSQVSKLLTIYIHLLSDPKSSPLQV